MATHNNKGTGPWLVLGLPIALGLAWAWPGSPKAPE